MEPRTLALLTHHMGKVGVGQLIERLGHWALPIEKLPHHDSHLLLEHRLRQALVWPDALSPALAVDVVSDPIDTLFLEHGHGCSLPVIVCLCPRQDSTDDVLLHHRIELRLLLCGPQLKDPDRLRSTITPHTRHMSLSFPYLCDVYPVPLCLKASLPRAQGQLSNAIAPQVDLLASR